MSNRILENLIDIKLLMLTQKEVLNITELSAFTGMSKSLIYKLTADKMIPHHKPHEGAKIIYFKKKEIVRWMTSYRVITIDEIKSEAPKLLLRNTKNLKISN